MAAYKAGIDVGSTTLKAAVLDEDNRIVFSSYRRHYSDIKKTLMETVKEIVGKYGDFSCCLTGSGGIAAGKWLNLPFVQEVIAGIAAIEALLPDTDVAVELGGEDAKITYVKESEQRMNGTCAGGTGAFLDQMATLLHVDIKDLNALAEEGKIIYPIASRCGVFAKSDIQPLLNDGAGRADLALSVMQSVVNQTVSGLACGKPIRGKVAFLGGPLKFMPVLRKRFAETLNLKDGDVIAPENAELFNAVGAALSSAGDSAVDIKALTVKLDGLLSASSREVERLPPLFSSEEELATWRKRHAAARVKRVPSDGARGACFLGIDAGSTTTKVALIDGNGALLYSHYGGNGGNPLDSVREILSEVYKVIPPEAFVGRTCVTGYGEGLIKAALDADDGEIETMAHFAAADRILPGADFVLDIGGQDMKCMKIKDGVVRSIMLNEACSSGCGSFLETFSSGLGLSASEFAERGLLAPYPADLGSRCTVFMNSCVKQAQKEGAGVGDISAGLSYSVVKNALFKVIKLRDPSEIGDKIIVQGGTFHNDSVLRAFELVSGKTVTRPDIAGLMGAYGCALIAKKNYKGGKSALKNASELGNLKAERTTRRCGKCPNDCLLTITTFNGGKKYAANNRCEKGEIDGGTETKSEETPFNGFDFKYKRLFRGYAPLPPDAAPRGSVGIPRVLGMYENYPFWFTFFTALGYRVVLSPRSSRAIYDKGIESMPSESVCYPAKLAHGHIMALLERGLKFIFYPCLPYEEYSDPSADNHYNCPIVCSYPEALRLNIESLKDVFFMSPFLPYDNGARLAERLIEEFKKAGNAASETTAPSPREIRRALVSAAKEDAAFKREIREKGREIVDGLAASGKKGIVLAGRPYHLDHEINHGVADMICRLGLAVLTEDAVSSLSPALRPLRVLDQWSYHSRLYRAAAFTAGNENLEFVQLNSFGCGLDAVTSDQAAEILESAGKMYTCLKIDEVNNLGAARIRIRSLLAAMNERDAAGTSPLRPADGAGRRTPFTKTMRRGYTLIAPNMSPMHFGLVEAAVNSCGYRVRVLPDENKRAAEAGLKYVNNDACYPAVLTIGGIMDALTNTPEAELRKTAVMISQTGGGCRASNYIALLRKALKAAGMEYIPVISFNFAGLDKQPGFKVNLKLLMRMLRAVIYGDLLMRLVYRSRPYEREKGAADGLFKIWESKCAADVPSGRRFKRNVKEMIRDFKAIIDPAAPRKPRVGVVGEILVEYSFNANNDAARLIEEEGGEAYVPDLLDFFLYGFYNAVVRRKLLGGTRRAAFLNGIYIKAVNFIRRPAVRALKRAGFSYPSPISEKARAAEEILSTGNMSGEGWLLTGEMLEMLRHGVENIICVQPFACLPNHVTGKGIFKELKRIEPRANIAAVDYDPGASRVNQLNRIKLLMSVARKRAARQNRDDFKLKR